jgi:ParB-like chromosome segregation protein Spo0J
MMPEHAPAWSSSNTGRFQLFDALPAHIEDALRASIERFGVLVPIAKDQHGNILDGHHRERIAKQVGAQPRYDRIVVENETQALEIAHTLNAERRQMTGEQLRQAVIHLAEWRDRQGIGLSNVQIADALHVSDMTVARELERATSTGVEVDRPERVRGKDGKDRPARPTVVAAKNAREDQRAQAALTALGADTPAAGVFDVKRTERIARETEADRRRAEPTSTQTVDGIVDIRHGDFREVLADIPDGSVDAIITDPPYPAEYIPLFGDLSKLAARILAPHGVLVAMTGQAWLRQYLEQLDTHLAYRWTAAYIAQGARTRMHAAKVGTGWKPLLVYRRRDAADLPFLVDDLFDSASGTSDGVDKQFHHWGQSESGIAEQVERFTQPGQLIVDPFLGGGTTAVACRALGRQFIGCDLDAAHVATSRERVA